MGYEDDAASEVMTCLWKSLLDPETNWSSSDELWQAIHRLVSERCIDRGKYNSRKKRRSILRLGVLFEELYGHRVWDIGIDEVDANDLVHVFLEKLDNDRFRQFVELKRSGLTNDEIAVHWQVSDRTVRRTMGAIKKLFDELIEDRVEPT